MSNGEMQLEASTTPETHTLRVAVFDFYEDTLVSPHGNSPLFHDIQPLNENGLIGISHEKRATLITQRLSMGRLVLKSLGAKVCIEDDNGIIHEGYATHVAHPISYTFFRNAMAYGAAARRNSLDTAFSHVDRSLLLHSVDPRILPKTAQTSFHKTVEEQDKSFDLVDALLLDKMRSSVEALQAYRR